MSKCLCENISLYEEGHRCVQCFEPYQPTRMLDSIQTQVAELIKEEFDNYAPCEPPMGICEFIAALKEVVNE